jgi:hypothetical protein
MTDAELAALLRSALRPVQDDIRAGDLWPRLLARTEVPPVWSWLDLGLAAGALAGVLATLATRPDWIVLLAYHL